MEVLVYADVGRPALAGVVALAGDAFAEAFCAAF